MCWINVISILKLEMLDFRDFIKYFNFFYYGIKKIYLKVFLIKYKMEVVLLIFDFIKC